MTSPDRPSARTGLELPLTFVDRHVGPDEPQQTEMLKVLGFDSLEQLMAAAVPGGIRSASQLDLPAPVDEEQAAAELRTLAARRRAKLTG